MGVSTHARTRRATPVALVHGRRHGVSTHARTRRATGVVANRGSVVCFNSRSHAASDVVAMQWHVIDQFQLTLARGERPRSRANNELQTCFNSRSHAASDGNFARSSSIDLFQLTLARGERPWLLQSRHWSKCFNSRSHAASDPPIGSDGAADGVSTHARTRRATPVFERRVSRSSCFNSRSHAASDLRSRQRRTATSCFNSRSHAASDQSCGTSFRRHRVSTHARTRRATSASEPVGP